MRFIRSLHLGRWEHRIPEYKKDIKAILSTSDHCGEVLCKDPLLVKQLIKQETNKHSYTENDDEIYITQLLSNELNSTLSKKS